MKSKTLYEKYDNMPMLIKHQLRVGGVGKIVAENWKSEVDTEFVTKLCLVHDVGNIVKSDFDNPMFPIDDVAKWKRIQAKYWSAYGKNAHYATIGILQEAGLEQFIAPVEEENKLYFEEPKEKELARATLPAIILMYADCRVTPFGVTSYRERIDDLKKRYGGVASPTWYDWTYWFEKWMQDNCKIDLQEITEEMVSPLFDELLTLNI